MGRDCRASAGKRKTGTVVAWLAAAILLTSLGTLVFLFSYGLAEEKSNTAPAEQVDAAEVRRQIAALAAPDDTVPYDQQAKNWLRKRRDQIVPQLIAALDDKNPKVAKKCLNMLDGVPSSQALTESLIAKAGDVKSPLRKGALEQLEKSAADPRVARLLDEASAQTNSFPDPLVRAKWAGLSGHKGRAVDILKPLLEKPEKSLWNTIQTIRLLGTIGAPEGAELLESIAAGDNWGLAAEAYLALSKIDPAKYGLTKGQAAFLRNTDRHKESDADFCRRINDLAKRDMENIRPFVMQMLRARDSSSKEAAASILKAWKDKAALPEILAEMQKARSFRQRELVAAYLSIDDGPEAQENVIRLLVKKERSGNESVLLGIVTAAIPGDRKVAMLCEARAKIDEPWEIPYLLQFQVNRAEDVRELLAPLMVEETTLPALGRYCELAAADKEKSLTVQVRRAVKLLADDPTALTVTDRNDDAISVAGGTILQAAAAYELKDSAAEIEKLMGSKNATICIAAQAAGARLGVPRAAKDLYAQLAAEDATSRSLAAKSLLDFPPTDEGDRAAREEALLACLAKPAGDCAMGALVACGGEKTVNALKPILDDRDVQRAVYAAWVMAQLPDKAAASKGLRRVAIFGLFCHQFYQQGEGIDFSIAPQLEFHQVNDKFNPYTEEPSAVHEGPVRIPDDLLVPFTWDEGEQQYSVRCYQFHEAAGSSFRYSTILPMEIGRQNTSALNRTHLPLLNEIAVSDSYLDPLMVQGQAVAHFTRRQLAAKAIAAITKKNAVYLGLSGETLDSEAFPKPYPNQNELLAAVFLDRVEKMRLPANSEAALKYHHTTVLCSMAYELSHKFGRPPLDAIRQDAQRRQIDVKGLLPDKVYVLNAIDE